MHAKAAPSKAHRWLSCVGSLAFCDANGLEDKSSTYAEEGTQAHEYGAWLLKGAKPPIPAHDDEMVSFVSVYTGEVRRAAEGKQLMVEVPIDISMWTGEPDAKGTADAVIIGGSSLEVHDLKYGVGVMVYAERNEQLQVYALGALSLVEGLTGVEITDIKLVIHQPRRDHYSEWTISRADLLKFGERVKTVAKLALTLKGEAEIRFNLSPNPEACQWCPAKAICPALADFVRDAVLKEFAVGDSAATVEEDFTAPLKPEFPSAGKLPVPAMLDLVETWLGAMRSRIFEKLQQFEPVPGWKLVKGREGNRRWNDEAAVAETLKTLRVPKGDSYDLSLKSPTQMEKAGISETKWEKLKALIVRNEGRAMAVSDTDPRPAVEPLKPEAFENHDIGDLI